MTEVYKINCTPSTLLFNKTPFELLNNEKPTYAHLRTFGCLCCGSTLPNQCTTFTPRAQALVFLGYPFGYKGYKLLDLESNKVYISKNVVVHESLFPFAKSNIGTNSLDLFSDCILARLFTSHLSLPLPMLNQHLVLLVLTMFMLSPRFSPSLVHIVSLNNQLTYQTSIVTWSYTHPPLHLLLSPLIFISSLPF